MCRRGRRYGRLDGHDIRSVVAEHVCCRNQSNRQGDFGTVEGAGALHTLAAVASRWHGGCRGNGGIVGGSLDALGEAAGDRHGGELIRVRFTFNQSTVERPEGVGIRAGDPLTAGQK